MLTVLSGCGRTGESDGGDSFAEGNSFIGSLREESGFTAEEGTKTEGEDTEGGSPEETELDWITLEDKLRPSVLQITCGGYTGSGVVWEITEEKVTIAGSRHLLKNGETCEVICYAGIFYEAEVERILEDCDIGFAVIPAGALREDGVELKAATPYRQGKDGLVQGEELAVYGSMDHVAGNFVRGYLVEAEREMYLEGYENPEGLLLGAILQEDAGMSGQSEEKPGTDEYTSVNTDWGAGADGDISTGTSGEEGPGETGERSEDGGAETIERGAVDAGMSGSGVFNRRGELVGILAGGDGRQGFAAVPVWKFM